jgi:aminoglycoside phosphotransferase (APT) family kinase protein
MLDDSKADAPYLVLEYIEGAPDFTAPPAVDFIDQFARSLAEIHRIDASGWGLADNTVKVERWWLRQREQYDESLQEQRILDALMAAWPWRPANEPTLLHGDYWPGNVLWRNGTLVGVIDWEEARRGDPLFDVAISRLDLAWAFGADAMRRFTETYVAASSVDVAALPYWDLLAALRPAHYISHWATPWPGYGRPDVTVATMRTTHRTFVEQAFVALARNRSR